MQPLIFLLLRVYVFELGYAIILSVPLKELTCNSPNGVVCECVCACVHMGSRRHVRKKKPIQSENHNTRSPVLDLNFHTKRSGDFLGKQPGKRHENLITRKRELMMVTWTKKETGGQYSSLSKKGK